MSKLMVSISGVRGVFGDTLSPIVAMEYAARFGMFVGPGKIIVGRDSRTTGETVKQAIFAGLTGVGCDVVDIGIVSTPTVLLAVEQSDAVGGIAITASHNPPEWNAMKFVDGNGMFLFPERAKAMFAASDAPIVWSDWQHVGHVTTDNDAIRRHIDLVKNIPYIDYDKIKSRHFKVVLDSVNGAGGLISPLLLQELGCEVITINNEPTGIFAHPAEPLNHNLTQLEAAVKQHGADLGFATDPDVDRLSIVSDQGCCIGEELSVALAELFVLNHRKGDLVVNLSSSMITDYLAEQHGVAVHRTPIGEINVGKKMAEIKSPIGGEGNGGIICPDVHFTRDAIAGMALILGLIAEREIPLSQIVSELPVYQVAKDKITVAAEQLDAIMQKAPNLYPEMNLDSRDGIKFTAKDCWIHIRKSGTEPIIRVYVESADRELSDSLCRNTIARLLS